MFSFAGAFLPVFFKGEKKNSVIQLPLLAKEREEKVAPESTHCWYY